MGLIVRIASRVFNLLSLRLAQFRGAASAPVLLGGLLLRVPANVRGGLRKSFVKGVYEQDERLILKRFVTEGDRILEAGAAIGGLATLYSKLSSQNHIAVEANPDLLPYLRKNLEANGCGNVTAINALASLSSGTSSLFVSEHFYSSSAVSDVGTRVEVKSIDVNELISREKINTVICDVEGFEYQLFQGLDLAPLKKILVEIHKVDDTEEQVLNLLQKVHQSGFRFEVRRWRGNVLVFAR